MADEQHRWLDRDTAERLLSGEPLDAAGDATREQAAQLARTLGALSAKPPLTSDELPGEAAALAAFRKVRADRDSELGALGTPGDGEARDAGLVRIGRRAACRTPAVHRLRLGRPVRLGLAAALAVAMVGGVAVAAGTGVLDTPFHHDEPRPAASVSAAEPPGQPVVSSPPAQPEEPGTATPDGTTGGPATGSPGPSGDSTPSTGGDSEEQSRDAGGWWSALTSACRDLREGRSLDRDRKRALKEAAGGHSSVRKYCDAVLGDFDGRRDKGWDRGGKGGDEDAGDGKDDGKGDGHGGRGDDDGGEDGDDRSAGDGATAPGRDGALAPGDSAGSPALLPERRSTAQSLLPTANPS
ncbi:hypothetical protein ACIHCM_15195 [Streptomyces sp. NPDC052023]|uniref:hypothetical protein n=1 Tax=Streptomyces sp. NPDC052023 TaxID=3365681 RepID=UPI0037D2CDB9